MQQSTCYDADDCPGAGVARLGRQAVSSCCWTPRPSRPSCWSSPRQVFPPPPPPHRTHAHTPSTYPKAYLGLMQGCCYFHAIGQSCRLLYKDDFAVMFIWSEPLAWTRLVLFPTHPAGADRHYQMRASAFGMVQLMWLGGRCREEQGGGGGRGACRLLQLD